MVARLVGAARLALPLCLGVPLLALLVAGLARVITYFSLRREKSVVAGRLFLVFCWVMLVNAFWHIAATLYIRSYAPGVATAALLVLPTTSYLLLGVRLED